MHVASLELCKELYELSGWKNGKHTWYLEHAYDPNGIWIERDDWDLNKVETNMSEYFYPAYDLGYLLRKLPPVSKVINCSNERTQIYGALFPEGKLTFQADTPEDAACKLAIELFKQGILK